MKNIRVLALKVVVAMVKYPAPILYSVVALMEQTVKIKFGEGSAVKDEDLMGMVIQYLHDMVTNNPSHATEILHDYTNLVAEHVATENSTVETPPPIL